MDKKNLSILYFFLVTIIRSPLNTIKFMLKSLFHQVRNITEDPKLIESMTDSERTYAWKNTISKIILYNKPLYPKPHGLPAPLIVSLTSYALRFSTLPLTLQCILSQTVKPDKVLLWISYEDKNKLTSDILSLKSMGLEIQFCSDMGPYTKIIPTLKNYPDHFIVTADDDLYYWTTWLEELVTAWNGNKNDIVAHRVHRILLNENQLPLEYCRWSFDDPITQKASPLNFATGCAGAFYPPETFHRDVLKIDVFQHLCSKADDVWLYWMSRLNGSLVRRTNSANNILIWPDNQQAALSKRNVKIGNDEFIKSMLGAYDFPIEV